ncbi:MAG: hypothetical protein IPJ19_04100 [Planctomycetes bacterium]|nr:hypothetical protein [Planctomycetota bacterium]
MSERAFDWKRDGGGLILFGVGAFVSVLMVKSFLSDLPPDQGTGTAALAGQLAGTFGALPCLLMAIGVAVLGARSFLTASEAGALRHALGLVGCTLGLAILFGAFSDTGGGKFGLLVGGGIGLATHATLGGLLGLVVLLGCAWFTWLREPQLRQEEEIRSPVTERAPSADPGVTAAEAAGLIPEDLPPLQAPLRMPSAVQPQAAPPSPYPEDVRLKGQVPAGARPIAPSNAASPYAAAPFVAPVQPAEPFVERVEPLSPGAYLASAAPAAAAPVPVPARALRSLPEGVQPLAPADEELSAASEDRVRIEDALVDTGPARPSWEQTGLGEDDEPVDAYGTPRSLIETLRKAREDLVAVSEEPVAELDPEEVVESEEELVPLVLTEAEPELVDEAQLTGEPELAEDEDYEDAAEDEDEDEADEDEDEDEDDEELDEDEDAELESGRRRRRALRRQRGARTRGRAGRRGPTGRARPARTRVR